MKEAEIKQADWDAKGLKPKKNEIIEAFKHLDSFDTYIESNFESKENFELLIVNDTLRMYKNDDIRMYNFNCITDTIVEVITTCNTYTLLTVHLL